MDQAARLAAYVAGFKARWGHNQTFPYLGLVQALLDAYNDDMAGVAKVELKFTEIGQARGKGSKAS